MLPSLSKIEFDVGTHIRCIKFFMNNGTSSDKAGGFTLAKTFEKDIDSIGTIEIRTSNSDGYIRQIKFFDRSTNVLQDMKGS